MTCDEYSQKQLAPGNIGGESQSTDISNLLEAHGFPLGFQISESGMNLSIEVTDAVNEFCGFPSPYGASAAKRNNSEPITDAVNWDEISEKWGQPYWDETSEKWVQH